MTRDDPGAIPRRRPFVSRSAPVPGPGPRLRSLAILAALPFLALSSPACAQDTNPRFGVWELRSDAPPPARNVMTYEAYGEGGMRITVESTNAEGETREWSYVTLFDGVFRPVTGRPGTETAVEIVDERMNRITTRRNGRVVQTIINVLSEDGARIENEYRSISEDGRERVSHAIYDRIR